MTTISLHYRVLSTGPLPLWLGLVLTGLSLAAALWLVHREFRGRRGQARLRWPYAIRATVVGCLALLVIQPVLSIRRDETRPALLLLALDRSRSMLRHDAYDTSAGLNLTAALGGSDLRERDDLSDRVRKESLAWQTELERAHAAAVQAHDDLSQGTPPRSALAQQAREISARLQAMSTRLRSQCDALAKLQARLSPKSAAAAPSAVKGPDPQWFAAPNRFLDQLGKLEEHWRAAGTGELSEDQAAGLLRVQEETLLALNDAVIALGALQTYGDAQFAKSLTAKQRTALPQVADLSRFDLAARVLGTSTNNEELTSHHTLRLVSATPLDVTNATDHTDLYEMVKHALATAGQKTVAGIVLASDGQQNLPDRPEILRELRGRGIPLIVAGVGLPETLPDAAIVNYEMATTLLAGSRATVRADLKTAVPKDTEVTLAISLEGNVLAQKRWPATGPTAQVSLEFPVPPVVNAPLVLAVKTPQPDAAPNNDQVEIGVTVLPEQARILVLAPTPRWDIVYLLKALAQKPWRVDTLFWRKSQEDESDQIDKSAIAKQLAQLRNYQFVVLDGEPFPGLTAADADLLKNYVTKDGGSLLVIASKAGPWYGDTLAALVGTSPAPGPADSSARLEPAPEAVNLPLIALAADGEESAALWRRLPAPLQVRPVPPQNQPLLLSRQQPGLSVGFHGRGKIYLLGCGDLFRLREWDGAPLVNRFLANLIDDALRPVFATAASKLAVYPSIPVAGSTAQILVVRDADKPAPAAQLTADSGPGLPLTFGYSDGATNLFTARVRLAKPGRFTLVVTGQEKLTVPSLASVSLEDVNFGLDPQRLKNLAELANGVSVSLPDLAQQLASIPPQQDLTTTMRVIRLWNLAGLLLLIVALMTADWIVRRRSGLVL